MEKKRVVLYGKSVILGSVGASLRRSQEVEVITLVSMCPSRQDLEDQLPDVILFDAEAGRPEAAFAMLETRPGLLLISIDPSDNQVRLWKGEKLRELSTQELVEVITRKDIQL